MPSFSLRRASALTLVAALLLATIGLIRPAAAVEGVHTVSIDDVSAAEGDSGTTNLTFTVTLNAPPVTSIAVDYTLQSLTAEAGSDFTGSGGTVTFTGADTTQDIVVPVSGDEFDEPDERFRVVIADESGDDYDCADCEGIGTITNDDGEPTTLSIADLTIVEGDTGTKSAIFTVTQSAENPQAVKVSYETSDGTAEAGIDYTAASGVATIAQGQLGTTITVPVIGDTIDEVDETFFVTLSNAMNAAISDGSGQGTITDDDAAPVITINDLVKPATEEDDDTSVPEGASGTTQEATFTVELDRASSRTVTVDYATSDGTAKAGEDYVGETDIVTFAPGTVEQSITVTVNGDGFDEPNVETFFVTLTNPQNATCGDCSATAEIADDDPTPTLSIADATVTEGNSGTTPAGFEVTLSAPSNQTITVSYSTAPFTPTGGDPAEQDTDFEAKTGTLTFVPGDTTESVIIPVIGDVRHEPDESFKVTLASPTSAALADGVGEGTITNDDATPVITVADASAVEADSTETSSLTFTVGLSAPSESTITVDYRTADDTATAGADYVAESGTLTFVPDDTSETVVVTITGDDAAEGSETFDLILENAANATCTGGDCTATGTILDDESPLITISDATANEGNSTITPTTMTFTVTLSTAIDQPVTVDYDLVDGTAFAGEDYATESGTITFAASETSKDITVDIVGDSVAEPTEHFFVQLSNPSSGAAIADDEGTGTINDNDGTVEVTLAVDDPSVAEGTSAGTTALTFTITKTGTTTRTVEVNWATADDTATEPDDYHAANGTVSFGPTDTTKTVVIQVAADSADEIDETLVLILSDPANAAISDDSGTGTILDDDGPDMSVDDVQVTEGDSPDTVEAIFTVSLDAESPQAITVDWATQDDNAIAGDDYVAGGDTLTFSAGETTKQISVTVSGDDVDEVDETFSVELSNVDNATIADASGVATIDDDDGPTVSIASAGAVAEGDDATFDVSLSAPSPQEIVVTFAVTNGTAREPGDYTKPSATTVTFPADSTDPQTITVTTIDDSVDEADEDFTIELTSASDATILDGVATATITDNDASPTASVSGVSVTEGDSGTVPAVFQVTLSAASEQNVTVSYETADGSALSGVDYEAEVGQVVIAAGTTTDTITIDVISDTVAEPDETFTVTLTDAVNATLGAAEATGTIQDDDEEAPSVSVSDASANEGDALTFTITLSKTWNAPIEVDYATTDDTAVDGVDYTGVDGTVSIPAGQTSVAVKVASLEDTDDEANETFRFDLLSSDIATEGDSEGIGTIVDDDEPAAEPAPEQRYVLAGEDGRVYAFNAIHHGDMGGKALNQPVIGLTMTPTGNGYWLVAKDGGIFTFGDADFFGSMGGETLNAPVLGVEATPTGGGYWLYAADGGIFTFGDAKFHGSTGNMKLNAPVIGMETTTVGDGYWLVAQDGGIFTFGKAPFHGSTGDMKLNQPVFDMAAVADGSGYWLVAKDGGIFTFGDLGFYGSAVGQATNTVIGMRDTPSGLGYWIADSNGRVMVFGDAMYLGDNRTTSMTPPIVGFAAVEA